jgi:hypothetical protein
MTRGVIRGSSDKLNDCDQSERYSSRETYIDESSLNAASHAQNKRRDRR